MALAARRGDRLERLAKEITAAGGAAAVLTADLSQPEEAAGVVAETVARLGRLDVLINNAGVMLLGPMLGAPLGEWDRMLAINLRGLMHCAHTALPHLLRAAAEAPRRVADLVNIGSVAGRVPRAGAGVYNGTKFGVGAFSESLRQEVTGRHVRVALVEPGVVKTELTDHLRPEIQQDMRRCFAQIEPLVSKDIAEAIVYVVTRPRRMTVNEILIRPTEQEF